MALNHIPPPSVFDVPFQLDAKRAVVPKPIQTAIDFTRLKEESASLAKRYDFLHPARLFLRAIHRWVSLGVFGWAALGVAVKIRVIGEAAFNN